MSSTLVERSAHQLADDICAGAFPDGLPSEGALCTRLAVSRGTIREAITVLQARGLIERRHGVGLAVVDRTQAAHADQWALSCRQHRITARELLEVRRCYEPQAAAWAAERRNEAHLAELWTAVTTMDDPATSRDAYIAADAAFHAAVAAATGNRALTFLVGGLRAAFDGAVAATLHGDDRPEPRDHWHRAIAEAIAAGDAAAARVRMDAHLAATARLLAETP